MVFGVFSSSVVSWVLSRCNSIRGGSVWREKLVSWACLWFQLKVVKK